MNHKENIFFKEQPDYDTDRRPYLGKTGSLGPEDTRLTRPRSKSQARECQSSNYLNGLSSQEQKVLTNTSNFLFVIIIIKFIMRD